MRKLLVALVVTFVAALGAGFAAQALAAGRSVKIGDDYFDRIDKLGGVIAAIKDNFFQREIAEASFRYQSEVEAQQRIVVGVNKYQMDEEPAKVDILVINEAVREHQLQRLDEARARRDEGAVANSLEKVRRAAQDGENTMPATIEAVRVYATLGEICSALRDVYGVYEEPAF